VQGDAATVTLDDASAGSFTWTVPAEVDDRNVLLQVMDGDEPVATAHVRVGDAEPMMHATGGGSPGGPVGGAEPVGEDEPPAEEASGGARESPGFTALAIVGGACVAVLVLGARRR
ncbi:MAG TPA: hypothetical protein VNX21_02780, partial [Candidatus Thermoplasmatota archaeon]|nr:hypothetical protein [Candidatus Thermoplasmatota archaeon]